MRKYAFLIAACCLVAGEVRADPVLFNIAELSGGASGDFRDASGTGFSASGDSITIGIYGGKQSDQNLSGWFPGAPIPGGFGMDCFSIYFQGCTEWAFATIGGRVYSLLLYGGTSIDATTNVRFEPPNFGYLIPGATAKGEYTGVCDGTEPFCPGGTVIADISVDLTGSVEDSFGPPNPNAPGEGYVFDGQDFVSTPVPKPASGLLFFWGVVGMGEVLFLRRRTICANTLS